MSKPEQGGKQPTGRTFFSTQADEFLEKEVFGRELKTTQQNLKMLVYGRAGVGKTVFGSTFPKPLILLAEPKLLPEMFHANIKANGGRVIQVKAYDDVLLASEFLSRGGRQQFQSIVFDSLTEIQKKHMDELLLREGKNTPTIDLWGENTNEIRRLVREVTELPLHTLFICSIREDKDEETGSIRACPGLTGRMATEISYYIDILGLMTVRTPAKNAPDQKVQRFVVTEPGLKFDAKDGTDKMERFMAPSFASFHVRMGWPGATESTSAKVATSDRKEPPRDGQTTDDVSG